MSENSPLLSRRQPLLSRRQWLLSAAVGSTLSVCAEDGFGLPNVTYGGHLQISLPLGLRTIDPHDPTNLAGAILGSNLFETLYQSTDRGQLYPTLAAALPSLSGSRLRIELRPNLRLSSGKQLTATDVAWSLSRAKKFSSLLESLGDISASASHPRELWLSSKDVKRAATLLSSPLAAIMAKDTDLNRPLSTGALQVSSIGSGLVLTRNPFAPRGGSYLSRITVKTRSALECLRDFEARDSDLGYFGAGLHQMRRDATPYSCGPTGLCLVLCGKSLGSLSQPGAMNESLRYLPETPFKALGLERQRADVRPYRGQNFELLVCSEDPWMIAAAEELRAAWSTVTIKVSTAPRHVFETRRKAGTFDALLLPWATRALPPDVIMNDLFALGGRKAPRGGRVLGAEEALRQLSLGLLGTFHARGALDSTVKTRPGLGYLDLASATSLR